MGARRLRALAVGVRALSVPALLAGTQPAAAQDPTRQDVSGHDRKWEIEVQLGLARSTHPTDGTPSLPPPARVFRSPPDKPAGASRRGTSATARRSSINSEPPLGSP